MTNERVLSCPSCGEDTGTHVDRVEACNAAGQKLTVLATGEDQGSRLTVEPSGSFQGHVGRRHAFVLYVDCELCGQTSEITYQQHKGQTLVT